MLLAGGVGTRVGAALPKQLLPIAGRPVLAHSIAAFDAHPGIDDIVVMMVANHLDAVHAIVADGGFGKVRQVLPGGATRSGTSMRALAALGDEERAVLLHDAARPLVPRRVISECLEALREVDSVLTAISSTDTVVEVDDAGRVQSVPERASLRRAQTPQGFRLSVIREAYARAGRDPHFRATDDVGVVLRYLPDVPVHVVPGDLRNIKVTDRLDFRIAEALVGDAEVPGLSPAVPNPDPSQDPGQAPD